MKHPILRTLPHECLALESKLFLDYIANPSEGLGGLLQGYSGEESFWRDRMKACTRSERRGGDLPWEYVVDRVLEFSKRMGTEASVLGKLESARTEDTLFVVTGQQPGVLGGPLLSLYKALTAVALAHWLERTLAVPSIPLFWFAGDDTDFQEIRASVMLAPDLSPVSASLSADAHRSGTPVGSISSGHVASLWRTLASRLEAFSGASGVGEWVRQALAGGADHGETSAMVLIALAGRRLAAVDGRAGFLREYARPLFSDFLDRERSVKRSVAALGRRLEENGYHAQLSLGEDSGIFLIEGGYRRTVPPDRISTLRDTIRRSVARCSPGVILRNLVQDAVFLPIAVVLGPAEIAYRAQLGDVYADLEVACPASIPRLSATFVPALLRALMEDQPSDRMEMLLREPARWTRCLYEESIPEEISRAVRRFRSEVEASVQAFTGAVGEALPARMRGRLSGRISEMEKRLDRAIEVANGAGKAAALDRYPFLATLETWMKPRGKPQERVLSCLAPFLFGGEATVDTLYEIAGRNVRDLMDGTPHHIVYSV